MSSFSTAFRIAIATVALSAASTIAAPAPARKALKLIQDSETGANFVAYAAPDAVRVENPPSGFIMAARAPKWDVYIWRTDRPEQAVMPLAEMLKYDFAVMSKFSYSADLRKPTSIKKTTRPDGQKVFVYSFPIIEAVSGAGMFRSDDRDCGEFGPGEKLRPEMVSLDNGYPDAVGGLIAKNLELPPLPGVPIAANIYPAKSRTTWLMTTKRAIKDYPLKDSELVPPSTHKKVKPTRSLFLRAEQENMLRDMYDVKGKL